MPIGVAKHRGPHLIDDPYVETRIPFTLVGAGSHPRGEALGPAVSQGADFNYIQWGDKPADHTNIVQVGLHGHYADSVGNPAESTQFSGPVIWLTWDGIVYGRGHDPYNIVSTSPSYDPFTTTFITDNVKHISHSGYYIFVTLRNGEHYGRGGGQFPWGIMGGQDLNSDGWWYLGKDTLLDMQFFDAHNSCIYLTTNNELWGFGNNQYGELDILGRSLDLNISFPIPELLSVNVAKIHVGFASTFYIDTQDQLWGWGANGGGQVSYPADNSTIPGLVFLYGNFPSPKKLLAVNVSKVTGGYLHTLAIIKTGELIGWGANRYSAITGDDTVGDDQSISTVMDQQLIMTNVVDAGAGLYSNLVSTGDNKIWACGSEYYGQLFSLSRPTPNYHSTRFLLANSPTSYLGMFTYTGYIGTPT